MSTQPPLRLSIDVESEDQRIDLMHAISAVVRKIKSLNHVHEIDALVFAFNINRQSKRWLR